MPSNMPRVPCVEKPYNILLEVAPIVLTNEFMHVDCKAGKQLCHAAFGYNVMKYLSAILTVWFVCSDSPSVCGWWAVLTNRLTLSNLNSSFHKSDQNLGSRLLIVALGMP